MQAWVNGRLLDAATDPAISVLDHGFTVGDAAFEAVKVVRGEPFALSRHLRRLGESVAALGLPAPDFDAVRRGVTAVLHAEPLDLGRIRITYTAGVSGLGPSRGAEPTLAVVAAAMDPAPASIAIAMLPWPHNELSPLAGHKTTSFAESVLGQAYAREHGAQEGVFSNLAGNLCEGTSTNVFYVVGGEVRTPSLASGCLGGITRELVLEWYGGREIDEPADVLLTADEIFLTSTTRDVQAVHRIDDRELTPGPVTAEAAKAWAAREAEGVDP